MKTERKLLTALVTILAALLLFAAPVRADEGDVKVASLSAPDITRFVTERMTSVWNNYYYNDETGDFEDAVWEEVDCWPRDEEVTVTMTDGTVISGTGTQVNIRLHERYGLELYWSSDQTPDDLWGVGDHTAQLFAGDFSDDDVRADFTVTLIENPITNITIPDITRYDADRINDWGYEDENGDYVEGKWTRIDANIHSEQVTVETTEGTFTGNLYDVIDQLEEKFGYRFNDHWESDETPLNPWTAGNTYTATQYIAGVSCDYQVTVIAAPEVTLTVEDIERYDTDLTDWTDYYDEEADQWVDPGVKWRIDGWPNKITVTVDGQEYSGDPDEVVDKVREAGLTIDNWGWDSEQVYGQPIGDEIRATFTFGFVSADYTIHVLKNPVESLQVAPITRYLGMNMSSLRGWDDSENNYHDEEWFRVDCWPYDAKITAVIKGVTYNFNGVGAFEEQLREDGYEMSVWWESDESPENVWKAGTHTATLSAGGVSADYEVTVLESPIESLTVSDITRFSTDRFPAFNWYYDEEEGIEKEIRWDKLDCWPRDAACKVVMTNGDVYEGNIDEILGQLHHDAGFHQLNDYWESDETPDNLWESGEHKAVFYLGGVSSEYTVTVLDNPITKIIVPDIIRYDNDLEEMHGYENEYGAFVDVTWYRINANPASEQITVETTAGNFTGDLGEVMGWLRETFGYEFDRHWDSDESPMNQWQAGGTYTATQYIGGLGGDYQVTVVEFPIEDFTLSVDDVTRYENDLAMWTDYYDEEKDQWVDPGQMWRVSGWPSEITATVEGREYTGSIDDVTVSLAEKEGILITRYFWESDQVYGKPVGDTIHATLFFGPVQADYTIHVVSDPVKKAPTAKTLTYNKKAQKLADAGTAANGTMLYAVTTENEPPDRELFTESIPTAKDPGTYYIWYLVRNESSWTITYSAGTSVIRFTDVTDASIWYYDAVYWALANKVTSGYGEGTFQPMAKLTRAQTVTFLYSMAGSPDVDDYPEITFKDVNSGNWYYKAVKWAVANGITAGYGAGTFSPNVTCTRSMIVVFLMNYAKLCGIYVEPTTEASFKDVKAGDWFKAAVDWAVENKITAGYGTGTFSPKVTCNRAMMVVFLKKTDELRSVS